jgi:hypothetical protein
MSRKSYPFNYPEDVKRVIDAMIIPGGRLEVAGSVAMRTQNYWGDIDALEKIDMKSPAKVASDIQDVIKRLQKIPNTYLADAKIGSLEEYRILDRNTRINHGKLLNYDPEKAKKVVATIPFITEEERATYNALLIPKPTIAQYFEMKDLFKDHIVRWTAKDILAGRVELANGKSMTLEEAVMCPSMIKIDAISWLSGDRYVEFSMIYELFKNGKAINERLPVEHNIRENIIEYFLKGEYVKVLKRIFSLANIHGRTKTIDLLTPILNSNLGIIYQVVSDATTLLDMLERHIWSKDMVFEIDQFKKRLSNIYQSKHYLASEGVLFNLIDKAQDRATMIPALKKLIDRLSKIMNADTKQAMATAGLFPLPKGVLP